MTCAASEAIAERVFSIEGITHDDYRNLHRLEITEAAVKIRMNFPLINEFDPAFAFSLHDDTPLILKVCYGWSISYTWGLWLEPLPSEQPHSPSEQPKSPQPPQPYQRCYS
jgi:hypothetical protein